MPQGCGPNFISKKHWQLCVFGERGLLFCDFTETSLTVYDQSVPFDSSISNVLFLMYVSKYVKLLMVVRLMLQSLTLVVLWGLGHNVCTTPCDTHCIKNKLPCRAHVNNTPSDNGVAVIRFNKGSLILKHKCLGGPSLQVQKLTNSN